MRIELTEAQRDVLVAAAAYYETELEDREDRRGIALLNRAVGALISRICTR